MALRAAAAFSIAVVGGLAPAGGTKADAAQSARVVAHRAFYVVSLAGPSDVLQSARGLAAMELKQECDGWRYTQRYELESQPISGEPNHTAFTLEGRESLDGSTYSFRAMTDYGVSAPVALVGRAEVGSEGGEVRYTEPFPRTRALPTGTKFAVASVARVLSAARAGEDHVRTSWFVGATPEEPLLVSSLILPAAPGAGDAPLLAGRRWRFVSGFFRDLEDAAPLYEGEETLTEHGVMVEALYRYDGYSLKLTLQRLEPASPPDC